ncbi:TPA: minor capsid protein [Streptococcus suis]
MADVRVTVDLGGVEKKVSPQAMQRGQLAMGGEAMQIMRDHIPLGATGDLRASGRVERNGDVSYNTVYARAQFYGTNGIVVFRNHKHGDKRWDRPLRENLGQLKKAAVEGMLKK